MGAMYVGKDTTVSLKAFAISEKEAKSMVKQMNKAEKDNCAIVLKYNEKISKTNKLVAYILKAPKESQTYNFNNKLKYCLKNKFFRVKAKSSKSKLYIERGFKTDYDTLAAYRFFYRQYIIKFKVTHKSDKPGTFDKFIRLFSMNTKAEFNNVDVFDIKSEFQSESDECGFNRTKYYDDDIDLLLDDKKG